MIFAIEIRTTTDVIIVCLIGAGWLFNFGVLTVLRWLVRR